MKSLAWTPPKPDKDTAAQSPISGSGDGEPQYPSLRFNGEQASQAGLSKCEFGETYELTIRVKAVRIDASSTYPGSGDTKDKPEVQFDVLACDEPTEVDAGDEEDKEEESKYQKPKGKIELSPKEAGMKL